MTQVIQPQDLLGRDAIHVYGSEARELIHGKTIVVTGAGGSIGSEIVRQVHLLEAKKVYYLDNDEYALYTLQMSQDGAALLADDSYRLADIRDSRLMDRLMEELQPDIVFHAAAHKHLPLLERAPEAAVKTNVFGTEAVVSAAVASGADRIVNISTDKAANPSSALGWSKRLAEHVTASYAGKSSKIASVRFGNVLGSRGSFLPTLAAQMANDETIRITHPDVSRFFMTIPEAAGLVVEAARFAQNGETYVLDMGESVKIEELVKRYAQLSDRDMPNIEYIGLRPGEKMSEELFDPREKRRTTSHPRIWVAEVGSYPVSETLNVLRQLVEQGAHPNIMRTAMEFYTDRKAPHVSASPVTAPAAYIGSRR